MKLKSYRCLLDGETTTQNPQLSIVMKAIQLSAAPIRIIFVKCIKLDSSQALSLIPSIYIFVLDKPWLPPR